jgi:hypothetical protein
MIHLTEIELKVLERYPITDKEKNCRVERHKRDWLRENYRKELEQKANSKQEHDHQQEV